MPLVDDNEEEAAPETPKKAHVAGAKAALTGQKLRRDFTLEEKDTHTQNCVLGKLKKCGRCRYLDLMATDQEHNRFALLRLLPPQLALKFGELELVAKLPWLALKQDNKGSAWVGCVACHAYAQERPHKVQASNNYADFNIDATKLLTTKPHVLLRHAKTKLHLQAVAALLDVPCGAQINITSK